MKNYAHAGVEPSLAELIADPIMDLLLARDGILRSELIDLVGSFQKIISRSKSDRFFSVPYVSENMANLIVAKRMTTSPPLAKRVKIVCVAMA